jgi:BASS family bile acid:Na+ symporter
MSEIMQFIETTFKPMVLIFTVANLFALGLQVKMPELIAALKNKKGIALIFVWGWVLGPALGYLITIVIPLTEPFVIVVLLSSVAPCAPFFPMMVEKARGDIGFAGALYPLVVVGAVVLIPLVAPLLIKGLTVSAGALAKPLLLTLLLPMVVGAVFRNYTGTVATKIFPAVNVIAKLATAVMLLQCVVIYARPMLATAGSFALLSATIFMVGMALIAYRFGFGLKQNQRSVMSLGMLTRNLPAILNAAFVIPNLDPLVITFIIGWGVWSFVLGAIAAIIFAKQAGENAAGNTI